MKTVRSFKYAFTGVKLGLKEHNMKVHIIVAGIVIILGFVFSITMDEWVAVLLSVGLVISMELMNTALEEVCDIVTEAHPASYPKAGRPKDIGAGAVLVSALVAACVGLIIFLPYIFQSIK
jgi:diacylglycerol kinase